MPHAQIATHQAKHTLIQLHSELAGKILDNKKEAERLRDAMSHVEAVIKLLAPAHDLRTIAVRRRKSNVWFKRGTISRAVLDVLRQAQGPLTVSEIASRLLDAKGIRRSQSIRCFSESRTPLVCSPTPAPMRCLNPQARGQHACA